jgi:hypothetical protein
LSFEDFLLPLDQFFCVRAIHDVSGTLEFGQQVPMHDPWSSCPFGAKQHDVRTMAIGSLDKIEQYHYAHHLPPYNEYNKSASLTDRE